MTVVDTTPPVLVLPDAFTAGATTASGTPVSYEVAAPAGVANVTRHWRAAE